MKKIIPFLFYFFSLPVLSAVDVEVLGTFPEQTDQSLAVDQNFYVHIKYTSDLPVRIYVRPYTAGKSANAISSGAVLLPPGSGETLGWFAMRSPGVVDEFRVAVDTKNSGYPEDVLTVPVTLGWKAGGVMTNTGQPEWIGRINQINAALTEAERTNMAMQSSGSDMILGMLIMPLLFGIPLLVLVLCIVAVVRWQKGWRYAASVPLVLFGIWLAKFLFDVARDATSHNLWPFEMLMWSGPALIWLVVLFIVRRQMQKGNATLDVNNQNQES